jgi:signal transduction histidine kinase
MAKRSLSNVLAGRSRETRWYIAAIFAGLFVLQLLLFATIIGVIWGEAIRQWLPELLMASAILIAGGVLVVILLLWQERDTARLIGRAALDERRTFEAAHQVARDEASSLQSLAAAVASARDVGRLFEAMLDAYQQALAGFGVPAEDQLNVIFLLAGDSLSVAAARGENSPAVGQRLNRDTGITHLTLARAKLAVSVQPGRDPVLKDKAWLQDSQRVICVPLGSAHALYGLVLLAMKQAPDLPADAQGLLEAIADQVALALYNFQLRQLLESTQMTDLRAEERDRQLLRQALHEGPSRDLAATALRLGLIRGMIIRDPRQATLELGRSQGQAQQTSEQLKEMVSLLRPLDLDVKNLDWAVQKTLHRVAEESGLQVRIGRHEPDARLGRQAMALTLYVLEGSLDWARKHGQATVAEINYWPEGNHFRFSIDDDGYGRVLQGERDNIPRDEDLATVLMRAKAERFGGRLQLTAKPGRGVTTVLLLPLGNQGHSPKA